MQSHTPIHSIPFHPQMSLRAGVALADKKLTMALANEHASRDCLITQREIIWSLVLAFYSFCLVDIWTKFDWSDI
jgi:hypothetical protein